MLYRLKRKCFKILDLLDYKINQLLGIGIGGYSIKLEIKSIKKHLVEGDIFIDVGGNIGEYSNELLSKFNPKELHIFEPSKKNVLILQNRFQNHTNVFVNDCGLSNINKESILYSDKIGSGLGSLTKRKVDHFNFSFDCEEKIKLKRFEDYWSKNIQSYNKIDFVKLDVEGHELDVLDGFGEKIRDVKMIQFEFGGCNIDTKTYFRDFWYYFKEHNFSIFRITPFGTVYLSKYKELYEKFITTNYISINNKFM